MTPSEFVNKLAEVAPSLSELERLGLSRSEAVSIRNGYICTRRDTPLSIPESNELIALMKYWDTSTVEVGMVRMLEMPVETERGLQIGLVEDDPLVAASASGELFVEERGTRGHLLWRVARSAGQFLDALAAAAKFLETGATAKARGDDRGPSRQTVKECAALAGGNEYFDFYAMLLGVE